MRSLVSSEGFFESRLVILIGYIHAYYVFVGCRQSMLPFKAIRVADTEEWYLIGAVEK